ncbi:MAG: HDOD domain-containing protein [Desulfopila sp.]|nr:HDOD domain-containing protein [Desulfopila sp.]
MEREQHRQKIQKFIQRMPSLSTTVGKVLEICSRTDASPNELNRVVSLDPVLTGQVLKLINSSYYSLVTKVTSLTRAITMLGMNTVKNMALSTAVIRTVSSAKKSRVLPTSKFWAHSIGVGACAKLLAIAGDVPVMDREEYFVGGLLHDLGKVPFGDEYSEVLRVAMLERAALVDVEQELLGIDHQEVGIMIAEKWKLNPVIKDCIGNHHHIFNAEETHQRHIAFVSLANIYINIFDIGFAGDPFPREEEIAPLLQISGLSWQEYAGVREEVETEIKKAQIFLQI